MRLGIIGDVHSSDRPPSSRTSSYREDVLAKLEFALLALAKCKVDVIIFVGDIFHIKAPHRVSHYLTNRLIDLFSIAEDIPILIQPGNHDLTGDNELAIERQPLATLGKLSNVRLLVQDMEPLNIKGGIDRDNHEIATLGRTKDIALAHLPIVNGGWYPFPTINAKDLDGQARVIIFGHMHDGPSVWRGEQTVFISPGALTRTNLKERDRKPCILVVTIDEMPGYGGLPNWHVERINVPIRPASEVFIDEITIPSEEVRSSLVSSFIGGNIVASGPEEVRRLLLANVPEGVRDLCLEITEEAYNA